MTTTTIERDWARDRVLPYSGMPVAFRPRSFRAWLTFEWTLVFGVVLVLSLGAVYAGVRHNLVTALEADLRTLAATEVASGVDDFRGVHLHRLDHPALVNEVHIAKYVQILTPEGRVVDQTGALVSREPLVAPGAVAEALAGRAEAVEVSLDGARGRAVALRAESEGRPYVFVVAVPLSTVESALGTLARSLALVGVLALVATALVGYRLATIALRPVDRIILKARTVGLDGVDVRLDDPGTDDELGRLTRVLNEMLGRLFQVIESHRRFASDASHELRSPLAALRSQVEVALRRARSAEEYRDVLASCLEEIERLSRLADDLLELARADAERLDLDLAEVDVAPVVAEVEAELASSADERRVALKAEVPEGLSVIADELRLRRVLANLVGNAIQYSRPEGGTVLVTAGDGGGDAWIEVRDDGIGLEPQAREHVFDRFWRADAARTIRRTGTGLGLAICREIVRAHGGRIDVESAPGRGSTFRVTLRSAASA
jgi:heavy metal sensor kinase